MGFLTGCLHFCGYNGGLLSFLRFATTSLSSVYLLVVFKDGMERRRLRIRLNQITFS
jgi:hypothetical protein